MDDSGIVAAVLMDLFEAYDCIPSLKHTIAFPHNLLIAKLHAYSVNMNTLEVLFSYLTNRKQKVKVNESFSEWGKIIVRVPQGSALGCPFSISL